MAHDRTRERTRGRRAQRLQWAVVAASLACGCLWAAAWAVVQRLPADSWPVALVAFLPQWLWLVIPAALAGASAACRLRWAVAGNVALLVASAPLLAGWAWPMHRAAEGPASLTVLTWNVHNQFQHLEELQRAVAAYHPDLVCLQEARDPAFDRLLPGWDSVDAIGLKLYARQALQMQAGPVQLRAVATRPWLAAKVTVQGRQMNVLGVHVTTNQEGLRVWHRLGSLRAFLEHAQLSRALQLGAIARTASPAEPLLVLGDFNTPPLSPLHRMLQWRLTDSYAACGHGLGLTYVARRRIPSWRIDYVWCGNGLQPVSCRVGRAGPSDHRPVIAELALR